MPRRIIVTSALPYANNSVHIGHMVEYLQTDIWVRFQKMCSNECYYFCADDTHGTPIMISARNQDIAPETLIERMHEEHQKDFDGFHIQFDNYYSTHSPENKELSEMIFNLLNEAGSIVKREILQTYCPNCKMALPDRFVRGKCPKCGADDQYGDSCDVCGGTYLPTELSEPKCSVCSAKPELIESQHYFFRLADYADRLKELMAKGYTQKSIANKLDEWFQSGLKDWDISRDGPYFGFKIPGEENKFFYVWLDAPIGYIASAKNYCKKNNIDFDEFWNSDASEIYHFIGKDITYFHALFWPAMLMGAKMKLPEKLFVHGFLTVDGQKMSKSKGSFIKASTYLKYLDPEYLRYYYAGKLTSGIEDIDLSIEDFVNKVNSDLVGKFANLASRSGPMLTKKLDGTIGKLDGQGKELVNSLAAANRQIMTDYENRNFASAVRKIVSLADQANRFVEQHQPWVTIKTDPEKTRTTLTAVINAVHILTVYLKPILPVYAKKIEKFLDVEPLTFADADKILEDKKINKFKRLVDRMERENIDKMIEESKESQAPKPQAEQQKLSEPIAEECTIDDFAKVDLRIAQVTEACEVEGADKLFKLKLDLGETEKTVFAGIAKAYEPGELVGKTVVCVANLKPRKMRFGTSEGMILAAGPGGENVFLLSAEKGVKPGQRVK